ncbi:MAG: Do family serine endopeptidase [Candidatus Cloacimonadaceae bacterium]
MRMKHVSIAALILLLTLPLLAVAPVVDQNGKSPFVDVVKNVREAVVQIKVEAKITVTTAQNPFSDDPFFKYFFNLPPQETPYTAMGSGFIFEYNKSTNEALILTNNHVVEKGKEGKITVTLADKISYTATIVGNDPNTDIAVIKIKPNKNEPITVAKLGDSTNLEIGDWAIAIGNPFGDIGLDRTVTVGVISAIGRSNLNFGEGSPQYQDYIQTDAAINPGNSGGPLINMKGEVIGINAAITSTSGGNIGIGFAIPINLAKRVVDDLISTGKVVRAYMGITPQEITGDMMESLNLQEVAGVLVSKVEKDSPADRAGIKKGDVIQEFNGEKVPNVSKFRIAVATAKIGVNIPVKILRDNQTITLSVKLDPYPEDVVVAGKEKDTTTKIASGITVEANDSQFAKRLNINTDKGVVISKIDANSPAAKSDLAVGDIILEIERHEVNTPADFYRELNAAKERMDKGGKKAILLYVQDRNKVYKYVVLKFE